MKVRSPDENEFYFYYLKKRFFRVILIEAFFRKLQMPDIFEYMNYRDYLRDFYREKKLENPVFSYQALANMAGFKSKSFIPHVIEGSRNISEKSAYRLARALKLSEKETFFFELLVSYGQAESHGKKEYFFQRLVEKGAGTRSRLMLKNSHAYYSCWYHSTIRELVTIIDFRNDYSLLSRFVKPRISARQAQQSVGLLEKLGLIKKEGDRYVQTDRNLTTGDTVQSVSVENFHVQNLMLAAESIDNCPAGHRELGCIVASLSPEGFERIKTEIRDFRKKLVGIINRDGRPARVYHLAMQLFPTSEQQKADNVNDD